MIYFIVFFLIMICIYAFDYRGYKRFYSFAFWGLFIILVVIAGMRYRIGTDSIVYERFYEGVPKLWELGKFNFESTRFEPGFLILASITRSVSPDFTLFQFFHAIIVNFVIFWFILKNTPHRFLCISFYFLVLFLNLNTQVMREALAVSAFLLAWPFFKEGKWIQYYLLVILASFMHLSALVTLFLPLFWIPGVRKAFTLGWKSVFIGVGLFVIGLIIQKRFSDFFMLLAVSDRMAGRVHEYAHQDIGGGILNIFGIVNFFLTCIFFPLVALYFTNKKMKGETDKVKVRDYRKLELMVMVCFYFTILAVPIFIFSRYYNYFGMFTFVLLATWIFSKLKVKKKLYKLNIGYWCLILAAFYLVNFKSYYLAPVNKSGTLQTYMIYYPYVTRLEPVMDTNREAVFKYNNAR